jgi:flavorubredoxin
VVTEIAPDVFRVSLYVPEIDLEFNHFVVGDEQPLLFAAGLRSMFEPLCDEVASIINPADLRWIGYGHFESDECGALNSWLTIAPAAQPVHGFISGVVNLNDFSDRAPVILEPGKALETGRYRFRFMPTPHVPHGWDAGVLFEESEGTLFCSDLFHQWGKREPLTGDDIAGRAREALMRSEAGPFANYVPYTENTGRILNELAELKPRTLAIMHGSSYSGDGWAALRGLAKAMHDVLGPERRLEVIG